ncbi:MAG: translation initiation factor IF-3 [bacterium]|nr:translation initiation factor IF-3 [bacterium]
MRISHKRKKEDPKKLYFFNEGITVPQVLVLATDNTKLGIMVTGEALRLAREKSMDLVEINPKATPPVVKIMNFGQFQYQQEKETRLRKAHQHVTKIKSIRLSLRIGKNDLDIRKKQIIGFLNSGDKAKIELQLRGRENQQSPLGFTMIKNFLAELTAEVPVRYDQNVEKQGNVISAIITKA